MEKLHEDALEELMKEDDGVNPNSSIPVAQQLEHKRAQYKKQLECLPLKARIEKALEIIQGEMTQNLPNDERELLLSELADAGETLTANPQMHGEALGITKETFDKLFAFAEKKLAENAFTEAAALFTLLTVLGPAWFRHWFFLGVALQELKEHKEALVAYKKADAIAENEPLTHIFIAECFIDLLDKQQAAHHLEKARTIMQSLPENPEWRMLVTNLEPRIK